MSINYAELLPSFRENEKYAEITPSTDEILVASIITIAYADKKGPTEAAATLDRFIASRRKMLASLATADEAVKTAYLACLSSFDAKLSELYGPVVVAEVTAESTRY